MNNNEERLPVNLRYKDTFFRMLFRDKKNLLELYNALNDTDYKDEEQLELATLENAIYMSMKNDLAFILDLRLHLYEHQSTYNPNMPLRDLFYVSSEYQKLIEKNSLYTSKPVKIPAPRFIVFYNGTTRRPERELLKLSDLYEVNEDNPMLELQVLMLNINAGNNQALKDKCTILSEYMLYVNRIRNYVEDQQISIQEAVERAIEECISEGILSDFLRANKAEAKHVSIFEYDEEKELRLYREAEREIGREEGRTEGREEGREEGRTEGREEGREEGRTEGREEALLAMVNTLKGILPDFHAVYIAITQNDLYKDITEEQVRKYF